MDFFAETIIRVNDRIPGMAFRARERDGRLRRPLRAILAVFGAGFVWAGVAIVSAAYRGFDDGSLNLFFAFIVALAGAMVLAGGWGCAIRGLRCPPPPALPDNVIPLHRAARTPARHASSR